MKQVFNLGHIMMGALLAWMEHPKGAKPFPTTVEKLCLKYLPILVRFPKTNMVGGRCNLTGLNHIINVH